MRRILERRSDDDPNVYDWTMTPNLLVSNSLRAKNEKGGLTQGSDDGDDEAVKSVSISTVPEGRSREREDSNDISKDDTYSTASVSILDISPLDRYSPNTG
jgi:hypothetical protein